MASAAVTRRWARGPVGLSRARAAVGTRNRLGLSTGAICDGALAALQRTERAVGRGTGAGYSRTGAASGGGEASPAGERSTAASTACSAGGARARRTPHATDLLAHRLRRRQRRRRATLERAALAPGR